jgi:hypothetical protein
LGNPSTTLLSSTTTHVTPGFGSSN